MEDIGALHVFGDALKSCHIVDNILSFHWFQEIGPRALCYKAIVFMDYSLCFAMTSQAAVALFTIVQQFKVFQTVLVLLYYEGHSISPTFDYTVKAIKNLDVGKISLEVYALNV